MSNNLLKGGYVYYQDQDRRVIDSNELIAMKMEEIYASMEEEESLPESEEGFREGLDAAELLLQDQDAETELDGEENSVSQRIIKGPRESAAEILEKARAEAEEILNAARAEAEEIRTRAREEGKESGYEEGLNSGRKTAQAENRRKEEELDALQRQLSEKYDRKVSEMEPRLMDVVADVYRHVFQVDFSKRKDMICNIIQNALQHVEITKDFIIHVSKEDIGFVAMQKKSLLSGLPGADTIEIVEDITLAANECLIETGGGIYDCSLGVQLEALTKELKLLSFEK